MSSNSLINLVQNDTGPDFVVTLYDATNNQPIDVSSAACYVVMKYRMEDGSGGSDIEGVKVNGGSDGVVMFIWPADSLSRVGYAEAEVEITLSSGRVQTVPGKQRFYTRKELT